LLIVSAALRPKTTISNNELAPNLFAPCTDADALSPADYKPSTMLSPLDIACAFQLVGIPPIF